VSVERQRIVLVVLTATSLMVGPSAMASLLPIPYPFCAVGILCIAIPSREIWEAGLTSTLRQGTTGPMFLGVIVILVAQLGQNRFFPFFGDLLHRFD